MSRDRKPSPLPPDDEAAIQRYQRRDGTKRKYSQETYAAIAAELDARAGEYGLVMDLSRKYQFTHTMVSEIKNGYRNARRQALRQNRRLRADTARRRQFGRTALEAEVREIVRQAVDRLTGSKNQRDLTAQDYRFLATICGDYARLFRANAKAHTATVTLPELVQYDVGDTLELVNTKNRPAQLNGVAVAPGARIMVVLAYPWHSQEPGNGGPWGVQGYTASLLKQIASVIQLADGTVIYQGDAAGLSVRPRDARAQPHPGRAGSTHESTAGPVSSGVAQRTNQKHEEAFDARLDMTAIPGADTRRTEQGKTGPGRTPARFIRLEEKDNKLRLYIGRALWYAIGSPKHVDIDIQDAIRITAGNQFTVIAGSGMPRCTIVSLREKIPFNDGKYAAEVIGDTIVIKEAFVT